MTLPPRSSSTWFNTSPALPQRDFRLFAGSVLFSMPFLDIAADGAYSETFAYGGDFYGNVGLRLGDKPWRLSLAVDGAGSRYVGSDGTSPGAGFRTAAKLERRGRGSSLFRLGALFRGPGEADPEFVLGYFNRENLSFYYRPPASRSFLGISRISLALDRDARNPEAVEDSINALAGIKLGGLGAVSEAKLTGTLDSGGEYHFESLRVQESLSWTIKNFPGIRHIPGGLHCSARAGCTVTGKKEPVWDGSFSAYIQGKLFSKKSSRFSFKVGSSNFPQKWEYTISWRLQY
jgi:hypothetical protein